MLTVLMLFTIPPSDIRSPGDATRLVYCRLATFSRLRLSERKAPLHSFYRRKSNTGAGRLAASTDWRHQVDSEGLLVFCRLTQASSTASGRCGEEPNPAPPLDDRLCATDRLSIAAPALSQSGMNPTPAPPSRIGHSQHARLPRSMTAQPSPWRTRRRTSPQPATAF